jgi:metacaspase-1
VFTSFDVSGFLDHDPLQYLSHPNTVSIVWRDVAEPAQRGLSRATAAFRRAGRRPQRRALLVGIDDYPDPANRLEGCVNDVYLMSAVLQENGFEAKDVRIVLNDRATADGIRERLHWLLDGVAEDDERVLVYSGHGAQLPVYGMHDEVDHLDECLVPWDFDWSREHAIADDQFFDLYSQLPYSCSFVAFFDCCHSGGMARAGSKVRGIDPPDDIRHRALEWNPRTGSWDARPLRQSQRPVAVREAARGAYLGAGGATRRLGRAIELRQLPRAKFLREVARSKGSRGPYLPVIFEACRENEKAQEYRHGSQSYGAFTWSVAGAIREARRRLTFESLEERAARALRDLQYQQTPELVAPSAKRSETIPWMRAAPAGRPARRNQPA